MRKTTIAVAFLVAWAFAVPQGWAQKYDDPEHAELAKALKDVKFPFLQGKLHVLQCLRKLRVLRVVVLLRPALGDREGPRDEKRHRNRRLSHVSLSSFVVGGAAMSSVPTLRRVRGRLIRSINQRIAVPA